MAANGEILTGNDFKRMIAGAYSAFTDAHEEINRLNVFPVPDGDTGTNMLRTLGAVAHALADAPEEGIGALARRAADSAIMGARGNSGVILSQIFRGLARGLAGKYEATSAQLGKAFQYGVLYAYRSVSKPVEGTILTVAKGIAKGARDAVRADLPISDILEAAVRAGESALARTPEQLPTLKAAGVVDAGGQGLLVFLTGCLQGLGGAFAAPLFTLTHAAPQAFGSEERYEIARPYCTEFLIRNTKVNADEVRRVLEEHGDSLIVAGGGALVKVHIHTGQPGKVLDLAVGWGTLHDIKIDNMADQHASLAASAQGKLRLKTAVLAVAPGEGFARLLKEAGAAVTIAGGQSMNPSVEEFVDAVHRGGAKEYLLLPNNKNILLAAQQVEKLLPGRVAVVPSESAMQGLAALLAYDAARSLEENAACMRQALGGVRSAAVTRAVRNSAVRGEAIAAGDYLGLLERDVKLHGKELTAVLVDTVQAAAGAQAELATLYYGAPLDAARAEACAQAVRQALPALEVELYEGGQPLYEFLIGVE